VKGAGEKIRRQSCIFLQGGSFMTVAIKRISIYLSVLTLAFSMVAGPVRAASHSEAPLISMDRYADNTDVYAFRSYEAGRGGFINIIANFISFHDP
jgi:hypothetical protein